MDIKKIISQFNIVGRCRRYGIPLWQCPQFLFLVMGFIVISVSLASYLIGTRYIADPSIVALIDIIITVILVVISFIITRSFEKLAEASQMKSEFISIVSHQLRSPITNIKWITDFLISKDIQTSSEKREEYFKNLEDNISRMVELVDGLLIVARIEQGSFPVRKTESSLEYITRELINRSKSFAEASGIEVNVNIGEDFPGKAYFDPVLIKLAAEILIDNAIRYSKKNSRIDIFLKKEKNNIRFEIRDLGVGIPESDQRHIFKKFFRSSNVLKEKTKGSGLGLYIAKSIIGKSGGKIWFKSVKNKGTTFYFSLPIK